jgi:hypothetical protein
MPQTDIYFRKPKVFYKMVDGERYRAAAIAVRCGTIDYPYKIVIVVGQPRRSTHG